MKKLFYILTLQYLLFWLPTNNCLSYQKNKPKRYSDKKYTQSIKTNTFGHLFGYHDIAYEAKIDYGTLFIELRMYKKNQKITEENRALFEILSTDFVNMKSLKLCTYTSTIGIKFDYATKKMSKKYFLLGLTLQKGNQIKEKITGEENKTSHIRIAPTLGIGSKYIFANNLILDSSFSMGYSYFFRNTQNNSPLYTHLCIGFGFLF